MKPLLSGALALALLAVPAAAQTYGGHLDVETCTEVSGWAWDSSNPTARVWVDIWNGSTLIATILADGFRQDLLNAGIGDGYHAFTFNLVGRIAPGQFYVSVKYAGTSTEVPKSPRAAFFCMDYSYPLVDDFRGPEDPFHPRWTVNGTVNRWLGGIGGDGSLMTYYQRHLEVRSAFAPGNTYQHYLHASQDAVWNSSPAGSGVVIQVVSSGMVNGSCTATLSAYRLTNGSGTLLMSVPAPCRSQMDLRTIARSDGIMIIMNDDWSQWLAEPYLGGSYAGIGTRSYMVNTTVRMGPLDQYAPSPVSRSSIETLPLPNAVEFRWQAAPDNYDGSGVLRYEIRRKDPLGNEIPLADTKTIEFFDGAVSPSTAYEYVITVRDAHYNASAQTRFTITTPPAGAIDPRRTGLPSTGSFWGAMGEQIDTRSGNLNFSLPLLRAQGRGGWGVPFGLSYNSQIWRQDSGQEWRFGSDIGYGYGWRLQAGSITPYWNGYDSIHHYVFTDGSGAEYRLDINTNGVWTSNDGTHIEYDPATQRVYFPDGSFWVMGAVSAGTESDGGARYPSLMQDTNGNQILVRYARGVAAAFDNSSGRILEIEDVRAVQNEGDPSRATYRFTYTGGAFPRLTGITNTIQSGEDYDLLSVAAQLLSPFTSASYSGVNLLQRVTRRGVGLYHQFEYTTGAELSRVVFPYGGAVRWTYRPFTYLGDRTLREVQYRYLTKAAGAAETTYALSHDDAANRSVHYWTALADPTNNYKLWVFDDSTGFLMGYNDRNVSNQDIRTQAYTWAQDPSGNPYVSSVLTTIDPGTAYAKQSKTEQTIDAHGNLTQTRLYGYSSLTTPVRTYTNTYLAATDYTSRHIWNRLLTTTVTDGTNNTTLVSNTYDGTALTDRTDMREHDAAYGTSFTKRGNVTQRVTPGAIRNTTYDIGGAPVSSDNGYGRQLSIATSATTNFAAPDQVTPQSQSNLSTSFTYTPALAPASVTGPNQSVASSTYDAYGRVSQTTSPHGAVTTYAYSGVLTTATTGNRIERTTLDGLGRVIRTEAGDSTSMKRIVDTEYDSCACSPLGKVKRVSLPYAAGASPTAWTTYTYDALGRTLSVTAPDGSATAYSYQGDATTVTDPAGKWKKYTTDAFGNLVQVTEPAPEGGTHETYYAYNLLSQMSTVTMPRSSGTQTRTFNYDLTTGRLTSATNPENGTVSYTYYDDGSLHTKTDAKNQLVHYAWDIYGRISNIDYNPPGIEGVRFTWDSGVNGWGRIGQVDTLFQSPVAGRVVEVFGYTTGGLLASKRVALPNEAEMTATFTYDNEGRLSTITYPLSNPTYRYSYDVLGRPTRLWNNEVWDGVTGFDVVKDVAYGPAGNLTSLKYLIDHDANRVPQYYTESRAYNANLQMTRLTASATGFQNLDLEYRFPTAGQNNGRLAQMKDWVSGEEVSYTYDSLNRLIAAVTTGPEWGLSFSYDGFGNLTQQQVTKGSGYNSNFAYDPATNRISTPGYSYDANGNLTAMPLLSLSYDRYNRLYQAVQIDSGTEQYFYNTASHQRIWKRFPNGDKEFYFYGPGGERLSAMRYVPGGAILSQRHWLYFAGRAVRVQEAVNPNHLRPPTGQALVADRLGSVRIMAGIASTTTMDYYPYGEERTPTVSDKDKFGTYYRDATTGLDYANNRYYASQMARFLTADPSDKGSSQRSPSSWNRYSYVRGDPTNRNDPSGLYSEVLINPEYPDDIIYINNPSGGGGVGGGAYPCVEHVFIGIGFLAIGVPCATPQPPDPPAPEVEAPPQLECHFECVEKTGLELGYGSKKNQVGALGYYFPMYFNFSATGGTGQYTWSNVQTVSLTGKISYDSGLEVEASAWDGKEVLSMESSGPSVTFFDAPGLAISVPGKGRVVSANPTWNATLTVTVSSGDQKITCTQKWKIGQDWTIREGKLNVTPRELELIP